MKTETKELIDMLPMGSYESGWSQPMIFPVSKSSMSYHNGQCYGVNQNNWRSNEQRSATGRTPNEAITVFIETYGGFQNTETIKSQTLEF